MKKRIEVLQSEVEAANSEVEHAKRIKEVAEEELNGYEVELSLNDATIQSLEVLILFKFTWFVGWLRSFWCLMRSKLYFFFCNLRQGFVFFRMKFLLLAMKLMLLRFDYTLFI